VAAQPGQEAPKKVMTTEELNRAIVAQAKPGSKVTLEGVRTHAALAVALPGRVGVVVDGEAGDFLGAFCAGALIVARAGCGNYAAYGMTSGSLQVVGPCGEAAGAYLQGGAVHVFGDAGGGAGWGMAGGEVVIKGNAGELAGAGMTGGELVVLGAAAGPVGVAMSGGAIFARKGTVASAASARLEALDAEAAARLRALAAALKVTAVDPAQYVRIRALPRPAPADAPPAPAGPRVRVEGGSP
jgi:glutamate synthase domain-containing protein 3